MVLVPSWMVTPAANRTCSWASASAAAAGLAAEVDSEGPGVGETDGRFVVATETTGVGELTGVARRAPDEPVTAAMATAATATRATPPAPAARRRRCMRPAEATAP